jgi:hypothetical protein
MKRIRATIALLAGCSAAGMGLAAEQGGDQSFSDEKMSMYGYATSYASVDFRELPSRGSDLGGIFYLRVKGDFRPQDGLFFHVEASYDARTGYQNSFVLARDYGLAAPGSPSYVQKFAIDQAWGSASFGDLSLQFGKLPIGWGSAYVFNPTQRAARVGLLDPVIDETPGTLALMPSWSPADALRLSGYLAFQDRSHRDSIAAGDGAWENLPFGARLQTTIGSFDLSASLIKEVEYRESAASYGRSWFAGADAAGAIWDFGVYAEAALRLPMGEDGLSWEPDGFNFKDDLELAAGFDYTFSALELELRAEYYRQGSGESDKARYDVLSVLSGERLVQAEDYLFARAERTFADYLKLSAGGLLNLDDRSAIAMAEILYEALDNLELKLGAVLPWGPSGSEFDGRYDLGAGEFDLMRPSVYASCKLSF